MDFKKNVLNILVILLIIISGTVCVYTVLNYSKNPTEASQGISQFGSKAAGGNTKSMHPPGNKAGSNAPISSHTPSGGFHMGNINNASSTIAGYSPLFFVYAIAFFGMSAAAFFFIKKKSLNINVSKVKLLMPALIITGLFVRITLALLVNGYPGDMSLFRNWAESVSSNFSQFYSGARSSDYPPFYIYILYIIGKIGSTSLFSKYYILLLKLPSIMADMAAAGLIYKAAKKYLSPEKGLMLAAFYIFNPAIFINSSLWGQVDSFFTLIVAFSIYLLAENKLYPSAVLFTISVLMKPQGIIFLPVLFFELVRRKSIKKFVLTALIAAATALIVVLPFAYNKEALWIFKLYSSTVSEYPYASLNAYNFFALIGANYVKDSTKLLFISYKLFGMLSILITTLFSWYLYHKADNCKFAPAAALIQIAGVFTFSVGMHERYLFPAAALAALSYIYIRDKKILLLMLGYSCTSYVNVHTVLFTTLKGATDIATNDPTIFIISLLNVLLFIYVSTVMAGIKKEVLQN